MTPLISTTQRVSATASSWPLHDVQSALAVERSALAQVHPYALMARAGEAVASLALALAPHARAIWIAAGPGNNGGDGLEAATRLHLAGKQVRVWLVGDDGRLPEDASRALTRAQEAGVRCQSALPDISDADLLIDALLGLGGNRAPEGPIRSAVELMNASGTRLLSVDHPTGLHADTGLRTGDVAVRAAHTLALLTLKPGLFTGEGRDHAGTVWLNTLAMPVELEPTAWLSGARNAAAIHRPRHHLQHKGSFGDVMVLGGAAGMAGAAWLAATAALVSGAGRVHVDTLDNHNPTPNHTLELMARPGMSQNDPQAWCSATVVCGCGGGPGMAEALPSVLLHASRLVLDADALNAVAGAIPLQTALSSRSDRSQATLLTPHPLEAARLLATSTARVQADRLAAAQALADRFQCTVLLKGSGSVCAAPGTTPWINATGNALLSTAGTGDVLAGWAGGAWSQQPSASGQTIGIGAAWLHGMAADVAAEQGQVTPLTASRLIEAMARTAAALPR